MQIIDGQRLPTVSDSAIMGFFGPYRFLSNYHLVPIEIGGVVYPSTEHAYMAQKTLDPEIRRHIASLALPADARKYGQTIALRADWGSFKTVAMLSALVKKFEDPALRAALLATGDRYLEETNDWGDRFWGVSGGVGKNMLGKLLMLVRDQLR